MDTQRLILFIVFSVSALFLWEAWQREQHPPAPPTVAAPAQPGTPARTPTDIPTAPAGSAPTAAAPGVPGAPPTAATTPAGQTITITTDLYRAEIDTQGGVIAQLALLAHRDPSDEAKPYLGLERTPERTLIAQSGLLGSRPLTGRRISHAVHSTGQ